MISSQANYERKTKKEIYFIRLLKVFNIKLILTQNKIQNCSCLWSRNYSWISLDYQSFALFSPSRITFKSRQNIQTIFSAKLRGRARVGSVSMRQVTVRVAPYGGRRTKHVPVLRYRVGSGVNPFYYYYC